MALPRVPISLSLSLSLQVVFGI
uniref:Gamma carbonic anhydrase 1 n=1 Tax=Rhizophora mucronata TaxID=61149 RepID=A0A2P2KW89_RHIMU